MKITKTKFAAATFGAAMTSLYSAPELSAQLIDINFSPGTVARSAVGGSFAMLNFVQFTNVSQGSGPVVGPNGVAEIIAFNFLDGVELARTFGGVNGFFGGVSSFALVEAGDTFISGGPDPIVFGLEATGVQYVGFLAGGALGWFSVDLGTGGDPGTSGTELVFLDGQFASNGIGDEGGILVGRPAAVPEPSGVGLAALALGAVGLRRRRKATASTAA